MRVLLDFHHEELYAGLILLFQKRLGWDVFRPIGLEWADEDFWAVYKGPNWRDTAGQYLGLHQTAEIENLINEENAFASFLNSGAEQKEDGVYLIPDKQRKMVYSGITLPKFKETRFDVILSSMPGHVEPFNKLQRQCQPNARRIMQVGNNWPSFPTVPNVLSSAKLCRPVGGQNYCFYHQELNLDLFRPRPCTNPRSVMNMSHYMSDGTLFHQIEALMPDWTWRAFGAGNRDNPVDTDKIPQTFSDHGFVWHVKNQGDGFGFNIFSAFASGRPMIIRGSYFRGMTCEELFVDGQTVIDVDRHSPTEVAKILRSAADDYQVWSDRVYKRFQEVVNYDQEFETKLKPFFERLM